MIEFRLQGFHALFKFRFGDLPFPVFPVQGLQFGVEPAQIRHLGVFGDLQGVGFIDGAGNVFGQDGVEQDRQGDQQGHRGGNAPDAHGAGDPFLIVDASLGRGVLDQLLIDAAQGAGKLQGVHHSSSFPSKYLRSRSRMRDRRIFTAPSRSPASAAIWAMGLAYQ